MDWLNRKPLYALLLLSEKPACWAAWQVAAVLGVLAAAVVVIWGAVLGDPALSWLAALSLVALFAFDWAWLAHLPRAGLSFGPVQPPLLGLAMLRSLLFALAAPAIVRWPGPALFALAGVQLLGGVLVIYGTRIEPFRLQVTRLDLLSHKLANPGGPLRIVHLSDLHVERLTRRERELPALVEGLSPDLIVITGDFLNTTYQGEGRALADLRTLLGQLQAGGPEYVGADLSSRGPEYVGADSRVCPSEGAGRAPSQPGAGAGSRVFRGIWAVWGTPEVDRVEILRPLLAELGITVLEDAAVEITLQEHRLWIMGVNCTRDLVRDSAMLSALLADAPAGAYRLLLYHTPDLMPEAAAAGVDLYLAGHTHGGQWRLPGLGAILTSSHYWKRYEAGHYQQGNTHLYVSRGLGMEGFGMPRARYFCPPEVVALTLRAGQTQAESQSPERTESRVRGGRPAIIEGDPRRPAKRRGRPPRLSIRGNEG
jgi:hypothetical protein